MYRFEVVRGGGGGGAIGSPGTSNGREGRTRGFPEPEQRNKNKKGNDKEGGEKESGRELLLKAFSFSFPFLRQCACVCVRITIKLRITAQSGPAILPTRIAPFYATFKGPPKLRIRSRETGSTVPSCVSPAHSLHSG